MMDGECAPFRVVFVGLMVFVSTTDEESVR